MNSKISPQKKFLWWIKVKTTTRVENNQYAKTFDEGNIFVRTFEAKFPSKNKEFVSPRKARTFTFKFSAKSAGIFSACKSYSNRHGYQGLRRREEKGVRLHPHLLRSEAR